MSVVNFVFAFNASPNALAPSSPMLFTVFVDDKQVVYVIISIFQLQLIVIIFVLAHSSG